MDQMNLVKFSHHDVIWQRNSSSYSINSIQILVANVTWAQHKHTCWVNCSLLVERNIEFGCRVMAQKLHHILATFHFGCTDIDKISRNHKSYIAF